MANILLAEDDADVRCLIGYILRKAGHEVTAVDNGREALSRASVPASAALRPSLIVSDVMMPEMDGYSVAAHLSADSSTASIPIILVSCKTSMRDICKTLPNVREFLPKPFEPRRLVDAVSAALDKSLS